VAGSLARPNGRLSRLLLWVRCAVINPSCGPPDHFAVRSRLADIGGLIAARIKA
jgi:hypothetical protein